MFKKKMHLYIKIGFITLLLGSCGIPHVTEMAVGTNMPAAYRDQGDTTNAATTAWKEFFADPYLIALIDTALKNNQELNITLREIEISRNEIRARKGEYQPFVGIKAGAGVDKVGRYTNIGAMEANTEIKPGKEMPEPLSDLQVGFYATWEADIWHKLRNAKKAALARYLSSIEGRNFMVTRLVAEIADSYYELLALDNQLDIIRQNIEIQNSALSIVRVQKEATRVTELAVRKFEAEVMRTKSLQYDVQQQITETENRINFLLGRYPQAIARNNSYFQTALTGAIHTGVPSQLLTNRPDIKKAEFELAASRLDVKAARARFLPSLGITAGVGYRAFDPAYLLKMPESLLYSVAADIAAPLINRKEIEATYFNANAKQVQAVLNYERVVLQAYIEVANQLSRISNLEKSYDLKTRQVEALGQSINISNNLFRSARADYMEVLLTQRDALEAKFELIETRKEQLSSVVNIYQALGGGWK